MDVEMRLGVFLFLFFVFGMTSCTITRYLQVFNDRNLRNKISNSNPFKIVTVQSSQACSSECILEMNCGTVFYNDISNLCAMYVSRMSAVYRVSEGIGWTFYHKNQNLCPFSAGYIYNHGIDRCIKVYDTALKYQAADTACSQENAELAVVDSYSMWAFIASYLGNLRTKTFYIQGSKVNGVWKLDDNTNINYFRWGPGEPDNNPSSKHMILWTDDSSRFHDVTGNFAYGHVCEVNLK